MRKYFIQCVGMVLLLLGWAGPAFSQGARFTPLQEAWLRQQFAGISGSYTTTVANASSWTNWHHQNSNTLVFLFGHTNQFNYVFSRTSSWDLSTLTSNYLTNWLQTNMIQTQITSLGERVATLESGTVPPFVAEGVWCYSPEGLVIAKDRIDIGYVFDDVVGLVTNGVVPGMWDVTTNGRLVPRNDWKRDTVWTTNANNWLVLR